MSSASSRVLLLGWNEAPRAETPPAPALRALVQELAPLTALSVLLPHEPRPAFAAGTAGRVTGLAELDLATVLAPAPTGHPTAWQAPAAPYAGSTHAPAAPYQGATPGAAPANSAAPAQVPPAPPAAASSPAPAPSASVAPPVSASSLDTACPQPAFPEPDDHQPDSNPLAATELSATGLSWNEAKPTDADTPTGPDSGGVAPVVAAVAAPVARVHATLTEALAALGHTLPSAAAADLNFQVIQYARFASSWALSEKFSLIYAVDWPTWLAAMEIRQLTGRPLVLHVHSLAQERAAPAETGWAVALERLALRRADFVLAASPDVADLLIERYQLPAERLRTVASTDTAAINELLHQFEQPRPGRPAPASPTPSNL